MIPLGYGKWVRPDLVYMLVPLDAAERGEGRRTYVHVEGVDEPVVASRSERAILAEVERERRAREREAHQYLIRISTGEIDYDFAALAATHAEREAGYDPG